MVAKNLIFFILLITNTTLFSITYRLTAPSSSMGFFSIFNMVLGALDFYEKNPNACTGLIVDFEYHQCYGRNWWDNYFEPINLGIGEGQEKKVQGYKKTLFSLSAQYKMSCKRGKELIERYIKVKPHIQNKIDLFVKEYFEGNYVIGIHYRGTDKSGEAPSVSYQEVLNSIHKEFDETQKENIKIFVATDEQPFLVYMNENFPGKIIALDAIRSDNGMPVHQSSDDDGYKKGEDAVIDCILLSRCSKLYKMASNLSDTSMKFNPALTVVHLNKSYYERIDCPSNFYIIYNAIVSLLNKYEKNKLKDFIKELHPDILNKLEGNSPDLSFIKSNLPYYDLEILGFENIFEMDPIRGHELITRYMPLTSQFNKKIDAIINQNFNNDYIIGVYYIINTDKQFEYYNKLTLELNNAIKNAPKNCKVLLITNHVPLYIALQHQVPVIGNPIETKESNYDYDLLTTILLSKSNIVIGLSSFCLKLIPYFSPNIPIIELDTLWLQSC